MTSRGNIVFGFGLSTGGFGRLAAADACVAAVACMALVFASAAAGRSIALTFDDGPDRADKIGLGAAERNTAILAQLADAHIKSIRDGDDRKAPVGCAKSVEPALRGNMIQRAQRDVPEPPT